VNHRVVASRFFYHRFFLAAAKDRGFTARRSRGVGCKKEEAAPLRKRPSEDLRCREKSVACVRGELFQIPAECNSRLRNARRATLAIASYEQSSALDVHARMRD